MMSLLVSLAPFLVLPDPCGSLLDIQRRRTVSLLQ
jgi:hypothetical protein